MLALRSIDTYNNKYSLRVIKWLFLLITLRLWSSIDRFGLEKQTLRYRFILTDDGGGRCERDASQMR